MDGRCRLLVRIAAVMMISSGAGAAGPDEFKVKREAIFEFARGPTVSRKGDRVTISFASTATVTSQ